MNEEKKPIKKKKAIRDKQRYENNKEEMKEKMRQYYEENKDELNKKITCECGSTILKRAKKRHERTKKHQDYLKSLED